MLRAVAFRGGLLGLGGVPPGSPAAAWAAAAASGLTTLASGPGPRGVAAREAASARRRPHHPHPQHKLRFSMPYTAPRQPTGPMQEVAKRLWEEPMELKAPANAIREASWRHHARRGGAHLHHRGHGGSNGAAEGVAKPSGGLPSPSRALHGSASLALDDKQADALAQRVVEKGSRRMMADEDKRAELAQGTFELDRTTERLVEEGAEELTEEDYKAAGAEKGAEKEGKVKEKVMATVTSTMGQTS